MTTGPDGAQWFTTNSAGLIGRTTTSGTTTFFPAPTGAASTWGNGGIVTGPDGALWFLADDGGAIGRMTTSGSTTTYPLPSPGTATALTSGPDGALWFTELGATTDNGDNAIGRITTTGDITMFTDPALGNANWDSNSHRFLWGITDGPDGNLWFSMEYASNETKLTYIGKMTPSGAVTAYAIPFKADPTVLTTGPDGAIWFGNDGEDVIGRVTTSGKFSEFTGSGEIGQVLSITPGPDGALWFTNYTVPGDSGFKPLPPIGRITTGGKITTYGSSIDELGTLSITAGSDGAMWFIDHLNDSIGRVSVP
jgi:virginiamycin B lyase